MAIDLIIPVTDINEIYGTAVNKFNTLRLYSASSRGSSYALITSIALISGDTTYTYTDVAGLTSTWYKVTLYNSSTGNEQALTEVDPAAATQDTLSRKELRQKVINNLGGKVYNTLSVTATTVEASLLKDSGLDTTYYSGWHLYRPDAVTSNDFDRRIISYASGASSGTLTHGGFDYADQDATSEQFEILGVDIDYNVLLEKINNGLASTRWLYRYEFGATSGKNQYNLPFFVEDERYVKQIWRRYGGNTPDQYVWRPIEHQNGWGKVRGSNFNCTLDIYPSVSENDVIALEVFRPGEALESETDFTRVKPLYAEAGAMVSVVGHLINLDIVRHQESQFPSLLKFWQNELIKQASKHAAVPGVKVQLPQPWSVIPRV